MGLGGISHWIIILVIVLLLFGAGRISGVMGELGKGLKSFKEGMGDEEEEKRRRYEEERKRSDQPRLARDQDPIDSTARREDGVTPPPTDERR